MSLLARPTGSYRSSQREGPRVSASTPRVLFAWEHGKNLGHLARLTEVATQFSEAGLQPVWALPGAHVNSEVVLGRPGSVQAAPSLRPSAQAHAAPQSYADVLTSLGFLDTPALTQAVGHWLRIFDEWRVAHVVLDYAPVAQFAALLAGLPATQLTNGFDAPPADCPLFDLGIRGAMLERRNVETMRRIGETLSAVAANCGQARCVQLSELLASPARWYDCIAETDPYGPRNDGVYLGPIGRPKTTATVAWPDANEGGAKVFAYLRSDAQAKAVLPPLIASGARVICAWPGVTATQVSELRRAGVAVSPDAVDLSAVLPECQLVVNYGSSAMVCQALLAGKPQLMLPLDAEKLLVARRVAHLKAGVIARVQLPPQVMKRYLVELLTEQEADDAARTIAARYADLSTRLVPQVQSIIRDVMAPDAARAIATAVEE